MDVPWMCFSRNMFFGHLFMDQYGSLFMVFQCFLFFWDQIYMLKTEKLRNHGMVDVFSWTEADGT